MDYSLLMRVLHAMADLDEAIEPAPQSQAMVPQYPVRETPWMYSMTKYGRPVSVVPASRTLAMCG